MMVSLSATGAEVLAFLRKYDMAEDMVQLFANHSIDGVSLCLITEADLREMGVTSVGHRKRLLFLASIWRRFVEKQPWADVCESVLHTADPIKSSNGNATSFTGAWASVLKQNKPMCQQVFPDAPHYLPKLDHSVFVEPNCDPWKVFVSAVYAFIVAGITSFVMVLAHERLPDMSKYPPLPDLLLDNLPLISWAFEAAEWVGVILMVIWITILVFHRYRWILLRRFFALMGTVFLLRSITMLITSLSVPGRHLTDYCSPHVFENRSQRVEQALKIWFGFGMSTRGIRTCGDYMFSGHTTVLTLLNFFITEYAPRGFQMLHTASWVLNLFGVFFILASHEHYSIDVFAAVYVSSRLFLYYHCLANNRILHQEDKDRAMIWFPLFSYLEYDVDGMIPNTYCIPFMDHHVTANYKGDVDTEKSSISTVTNESRSQDLIGKETGCDTQS